MTNFENGVIANGAKLSNPTNYKVEIDPTNATPLKVTGGTSTTSLKIGASGDTINTLITYSSSNTNVAAVNVAAAFTQEVNATVTGAVNGDKILAINKTTAVAGLHVLGGYVSAANTVRILMYGTANANAHVDTFKVTIQR